ncbi:GNAT family N-acetyltransferase [Paenibacillus elgii]|uniref:GNAT family N-acetyltransferase n=1 Tax=Paenibacillus elgii TaxID=189691 RepID=UPI002041EF54|nr:GNAT family N-acetyltransferase [Paenibacillus elgii]MCM3269742.1 GNAT family N-acetyltransferase [Paenibacillus elgii]
MTAAPITIEPIQAKYNSQVSRLLVQGFGRKFQNLTSMSDGELALFFEKLLDHFPADPASQRMVALQDGEVIGTISIKWKPESTLKQKQNLPSWESFNRFGTWNLLKMRIGLYLFDHKPEAGECYISDVAVHPEHRGKGVGKLLLQWAQYFVQTKPSLDRLSLYVSGKNPRAKQLYEQLLFRTHSQTKSLMWHLLFKEMKWDYMVMRSAKEALKGDDAV